MIKKEYDVVPLHDLGWKYDVVPLYVMGETTSNSCLATSWSWQERGFQTKLISKNFENMTLPGLEPGISGSVDRCLIHWATGPMLPHLKICENTNPQNFRTMLCVPVSLVQGISSSFSAYSISSSMRMNLRTVSVILFQHAPDDELGHAGPRMSCLRSTRTTQSGRRKLKIRSPAIGSICSRRNRRRIS